jgi:hypothetical protein
MSAGPNGRLRVLKDAAVDRRRRLVDPALAEDRGGAGA